MSVTCVVDKLYRHSFSIRKNLDREKFLSFLNESEYL